MVRQDPHDRYRDHCNGILQSGSEAGLNSEYYRMDKWEFTDKEQGEWGSVDGKLPGENIRGKGGFWLNPPNRILADQTSPG